MTPVRLILICASLVCAHLSAQAAFFTADLSNPTAGTGKGTHLIIVGKGLEVGDQWLKAAHTQAMIFRDRPGMGSIRLIAAIENSNFRNQLANWGYNNLKVYNQTMTGNEVLGQIFRVNKIESIDFIGHNGALYGFALEDYNNRFFLKHAKELTKIRDRMSANSYVRILGCNTGWYLAPAVANALNVPAAGSFTYADIEELHDTQEWFYNDAGRYPKGSWLKSNPISYSDTKPCVGKGGCVRLKVVNSSYQGKHGNYGGTLPFMKYFCGALSNDECFRRMALSTATLVSIKPVQGKPSKGDYADIVAEQFCPSWIDSVRRQDCRKKVSEHLLGINSLPPFFSSTSETSMTCDFKTCKFVKNCGDSSCVVDSTTSGASKTYVNELNAYKRGFDLW